MARYREANVFFTASVLGMRAVSHVIEDQAATMGGTLRFYSGFQKLSRVNAQKERYLKILATGNPVYIFSVPDVELWDDPNLHVVELENEPDFARHNLSHNWFLVLHNPQLASMALITRELSNDLPPTHALDRLVYRNFEGFWTYDQEIIGRVVEILDDYIHNH